MAAKFVAGVSCANALPRASPAAICAAYDLGYRFSQAASRSQGKGWPNAFVRREHLGAVDRTGFVLAVPVHCSVSQALQRRSRTSESEGAVIPVRLWATAGSSEVAGTGLNCEQ